jgi:hypothetical protein
MRRAALALAVLLAACGGAEGPDVADAGGLPGPDATTGKTTRDLYQSGTRLKARMLVTADGAKAFVGWRDTVRNENCSFWNTADGKLRCLPTACAGPISTPPRMYADENCTGYQIVPISGTSAPSCVSLLDSAGSVSVFKDIAPASVGTTVYIDSDPTTAGCTSNQPSSLYAGGFMRLAAPVQPSEFVEAVERLE